MRVAFDSPTTPEEPTSMLLLPTVSLSPCGIAKSNVIRAGVGDESLPTHSYIVAPGLVGFEAADAIGRIKAACRVAEQCVLAFGCVVCAGIVRIERGIPKRGIVAPRGYSSRRTHL